MKLAEQVIGKVNEKMTDNFKELGGELILAAQGVHGATSEKAAKRELDEVINWVVQVGKTVKYSEQDIIKAVKNAES